jgi:hypothetical protein
MWNSSINDWALTFLDYADIMVEAKCKNLASIDLYKYYKGTTNELSKQDVRKSKEDTRDTVFG